MPLFIAQFDPAPTPVTLYPSTVSLHLVSIGGSKIGDTAVANPAFIRVTYTLPPDGDFVDRRVAEVITATRRNIVIWGVDSTATLPKTPPQPITGNPGLTTWTSHPFPPPEGQQINIIYDTTDCGPNPFHWVAGVGPPPDRQIINASPIILFHELCHAWHLDNGTAPRRPGGQIDDSAAEVQAINDENQARQARAIEGPRDPTRITAGGCGYQPAGPPPPPPPGRRRCFMALIVSAAFGSPRAPQVKRFRQLRDNLLRQSAFGDEFFEHLYAEYYQFSPRIAADMNASGALKISISKLVVEPLLDFFMLVESYVEGGWQRKDFGDQAEQALARFLAGLPEAGLHQDQAESIYNAVAQLKARLDGLSGGRRRRALPPAPSACNDPRKVLNYMADVVETAALDTEYSSWALMAPLTLYWSALTRLKSPPAQGVCLGSYFAEAIDSWLGTIPIPPGFERLSEDALREDLGELAESVFTVPSMRQRFAARLLEHSGDRVSYDLKGLLEEVGYL